MGLIQIADEGKYIPKPRWTTSPILFLLLSLCCCTFSLGAFIMVIPRGLQLSQNPVLSYFSSPETGSPGASFTEIASTEERSFLLNEAKIEPAEYRVIEEKERQKIIAEKPAPTKLLPVAEGKEKLTNYSFYSNKNGFFTDNVTLSMLWKIHQTPLPKKPTKVLLQQYSNKFYKVVENLTEQWEAFVLFDKVGKELTIKRLWIKTKEKEIDI